MLTSTKSKVTVGGSIAAAVLAILASVVDVEYGYSNHPNDPGGATNHGITEKVARANDYKGDMRDLTVNTAKSIYFEDYIVKPGYLPIVESQPALAHKIIDAGVNAGTARSSRWFQQSLNALSRGGKDFPLITADGKVGPATVAAYKSLERVRGKVKACTLSLKLMDAYQAMHYVDLKMHDFTVGWVDHRIGNIPLNQCKDTVP